MRSRAKARLLRVEGEQIFRIVIENRDLYRRRMAKAKKKTTTKPTKPAAKHKKAAKRSAPGLTDEQRASKLRPPAAFDDALAKLAGVMDQYKLRMPGLTSSKMRSNAKRAQADWTREDKYRQQVEPKLRALADARIVSEDLAWRAALDVYDFAKSLGRRDPRIAAAVEFMGDYVGGGGSKAGGGGSPPAS